MKNFVITYRLETDDLFCRREVNHAGPISAFLAKHPDARIIEYFEGLLLSKQFVWDAAMGERADALLNFNR